MTATLDAYADGPHLMAWCEHEKRWHSHGRCGNPPGLTCLHDARPVEGVVCTCPAGNGDGHRVAHCSCERSPHYAAGYILREVGPFTAAIRRGHGKSRISGPCPAVECAPAVTAPSHSEEARDARR